MYHFILEKITKQSSSYIRGVQLLKRGDSMDAVLDLCVGKCSIDLLLEASADVNIADKDGNNVTHLVAKQGNLKLMKTILHYDADLTFRNNRGETPLSVTEAFEMFSFLKETGSSLTTVDLSANTLLHMYANSNVDCEVFSKTLNYLPQLINARNHDRQTPLHLACISCSREKVEMLCKAGADINAIDSAGCNALHLVLYSKNSNFYKPVVKLLLKEGIAANLPCAKGLTPLHVSLRCADDVNTVEDICSYARDVNCRDGGGLLPANVAIRLGKLTMLQTLINHSATIEDESDICLSEKIQQLHIYENNNVNNNTENDKRYFPNNLVNENLFVSGFHLAVEHKDAVVVRELLKRPLNPNIIDKKGLSPLQLAIRRHSPACYKALLGDTRVNVDTRAKDNFNVLHDCITNDVALSIISIILDRSHKYLNEQNDNGDTALHLCVLHSRLHCIELLANVGADVTLYNKKNDTVFHSAVKQLRCEKSCRDCLLYLITDDESKRKSDRIAYCLQQKDGTGKTVLHLTLLRGFTELFIMLVAALAGSALNSIDCDGYSVLHYAARSGNTKACNALLQAGACVTNLDHSKNSIITNSRSPLSLAAKHGHADIIRLLLEIGANMNDDAVEYNALVCALHNGQNTAALELLDFGLNNESLVLPQTGETLLHLAAAKCSNCVVRKLLNKLTLEKRDRNQRTAIHYAVKNSNENVLTMLLQNGALVNVQDQHGDTPLHLCISYNQADLLITHGADIEIKNKNGETPLHKAAMLSDADVIEVLIANEAKINEKDINNKTPILIAIEASNFFAADILLQYDADVTLSDNLKETAFHKAVKVRNVKSSFLRQLLEHGASLRANDSAGRIPYDVASSEVKQILNNLQIS